MTRTAKNQRRSLGGFLILVVFVAIGGAILWAQGELINPLESTALVIGMSSSDSGFAMVGDRSAPPSGGETVSDASADAVANAETAATVTTAATESTVITTGSMTLETLTAELAAAGVDVEAVSASMSAEGRSLENLLAVVNSGRVTVADLAIRLNGESDSTTDSTTSGDVQAQPPSSEGSTSLFDFRWDEFGSVVYDLWVMLAATVIVIVIARPAGWVVNRIKRTRETAAA